MCNKSGTTLGSLIGVAKGGGGRGANWNVINNKIKAKKPIVFSVSVSFSILAYNSTRVQQ